MILDLYGVPFHAMVVFGHDREFLFNPAWAYCDTPHVSNYDNNSFVYLFILQTASSSGDPHVHIIKQVKPTDEGLYTCIAGNVLGQATASAYLEVNAAVRQLSFDSCNLLFLLLLLLIAQNQLWINRLRRPLMAES